MINVLFVCLGNICRSPMAEGSFKYLIQRRGLPDKISCDSAGTSSYHIGERPDTRMCETAQKHGIVLQHAARQLTEDDFKNFDYIIAMDSKNYQNIKLLADTSGKPLSYKVFLMREFDRPGSPKDVPDPYFGGMGGFEEVYEMVTRCSENLLEFIIKEHNLE